MVWKQIVLVITVVIIVVLGYLFVIGRGEVSAQNSVCFGNNTCELSLCDCKCHLLGQTPERKDKIVCGKNCLDWYNVSGCECRDNVCVETTV